MTVNKNDGRKTLVKTTKTGLTLMVEAIRSKDFDRLIDGLDIKIRDNEFEFDPAWSIKQRQAFMLGYATAMDELVRLKKFGNLELLSSKDIEKIYMTNKARLDDMEKAALMQLAEDMSCNEHL